MAGRYAMDLGVGKRRKSRIDAAIESSVRGTPKKGNAKAKKVPNKTR